ncbi:MAG: HepT-like ribonuclease domain-containing protein [Planctomycetota bacterium]
MCKNDIIRIRHMVDAAKEALSFSANKRRCDFDSNRMLALSVVRCIEVIGEAAVNVSKECMKKCPEVPHGQVLSV